MRSAHLVAIIIGGLLLSVVAVVAELVPLPRAHAHNDYKHDRPLLDALSEGFGSVEADVFLIDGKLLVAHSRDECRDERSFSALYLDPLAERIGQHHGVYNGFTNFCLWVDIKIDTATAKDPVQGEQLAEATVQAVCSAFSKYPQFRRGSTNLVNLLFTGAVPKTFTSCPTCFDGKDRKFSVPISENWQHTFKWRGIGTMPPQERAALRSFVAKVHASGDKVRFWAVPENPVLWKELVDANVDWVGTDKLKELANFLKKYKKEASRNER